MAEEKRSKTYSAFMQMPEKTRKLFITGVVTLDINWKSFFKAFTFDDFCLDSPIESIRYMVLSLVNTSLGIKYKVSRQRKFIAGDRKYYVDFFIENKRTHKAVIVECDGHDFHEKTKEQVNYGNKRDYDLKKLGYDVLHFTGSRIYNDPISCALEVFDFID